MTWTDDSGDPMSRYEARHVAGDWHSGQGSPLYAFTSSGKMIDGLAAEVRECLAETKAHRGNYTEADRDALRRLLAHVEAATSPHWHSGHNLAGFLPTGDVDCYTDPDEAVSAYVDMVTAYADADDEQTYEANINEGWIVDEPPAMRATVDSILTDDGPVTGEGHGMIVEDGSGNFVSFWLTSVPAADCDGGERVGSEDG